MARPLRIEFAGALYHVTARGNAREDIYRDDANRQQFLMLLQNTVNRYDWYCHAYCLMNNHYHLLIETNTPTLSKGMKFFSGTYTQYFNRQHQRVGHVFQSHTGTERFPLAGIGALHCFESGACLYGA